MLTRTISLFLLVLALHFGIASAQDKSPAATVEEAAAVLDLTQFPRINPVEDANVSSQVVAMQNYLAKGKVQEVSKALQAALAARGLKELEGAMITDAYSSANYQAKGFLFTLSVTPSGNDQVMVVIQNLGNVDLSKLRFQLAQNCCIPFLAALPL